MKKLLNAILEKFGLEVVEKRDFRALIQAINKDLTFETRRYLKEKANARAAA